MNKKTSTNHSKALQKKKESGEHLSMFYKKVALCRACKSEFGHDDERTHNYCPKCISQLSSRRSILK